MNTGKLAAGMARAGVALVGLTVLQGAAFPASGAYLLIVAPLVGLLIAGWVYWVLHQRCTTGNRFSGFLAAIGIVLLVVIAIFGISFGGVSLLLPAVVLAVAAVLTPRAAALAPSC